MRLIGRYVPTYQNALHTQTNDDSVKTCQRPTNGRRARYQTGKSTVIWSLIGSVDEDDQVM
jgi:hypothetical protein